MPGGDRSRNWNVHDDDRAEQRALVVLRRRGGNGESEDEQQVGEEGAAHQERRGPTRALYQQADGTHEQEVAEHRTDNPDHRAVQPSAHGDAMQEPELEHGDDDCRQRPRAGMRAQHLGRRDFPPIIAGRG